MTMTDAPARRIPPSLLSNRLRDAREWRGLDQVDIAKELGISRATVSNYERGVTTPGKLVVNAWAVVTDVEVEWLKTGTEQTDTNPDGGGAPQKITEWLLASGNVTHANFGRGEQIAA